MAFRYLIYRTDYGNTIVRESPTDTSTGGTEQSLFTDFVIPAIQPLYLWRVTGGTSVVPNTDQNIYDWLQNIKPAPNPDDNATVGYVTGLTETKINIVTGATGNVGIFLADGNLEDSGFSIADLTGATSGVTYTVFNAYTGATETRLQGIESDLDTVSGQTDINTNNIATISGETANKLDITIFNTYTGDTQPVIDSALTGVTNLGTGTTLGSTSGRNATIKSISVLGGLNIGGDSDNIIISGETNAAAVWGNITGTLSNQTDLWNELTGKTSLTLFNTYTGDTETRLQGIESDIIYLSGQTDLRLTISDFTTYTGNTETRLQGIESDIVYLSGQTDLKLNISDFNIYTGDTETRLQGIESDITDITGVTNVALTGATNGLTANGRVVELGGALTKDTVISGTTHDFTLNVADITLQSTGSINIIDTSGSGVDIESDSGTIDIIGNTSLSVERTKLTISESQMLITDSRGTTSGLQYAADYSTDYTNRSLVDKGYVDAVAAGLDLKESVKVATTTGNTDIDLTLGTFGGTIDGYSVQDGDRVLIKNQASAKEDNGIYIYSSGGNTFARAIDFDNPNVTTGAFTFVETGNTNSASGWVLVTSDPINIGTTELTFTQFSEAGQLQPGVGINIVGNTISINGASLAGNSISWTGNTFNVDINSGTLSTALNSKLNITDFNSYSGTTDSRINNIESDIISLSGETAGKLEISTFTGYTATTEIRLQGIESDITTISGITETKLDANIFTGYTASTASNEIFLIHTGGTELNTVLATGISWDSVEISGTSYSWTGGTDIKIIEKGDYEINYNIPFSSANNSSLSIGANIILNNNIVIDVTASAGMADRTLAAGSVNLSPVILSLNASDILTLATFRTSQSGSAISTQDGSILIKKKNTLQ